MRALFFVLALSAVVAAACSGSPSTSTSSASPGQDLLDEPTVGSQFQHWTELPPTNCMNFSLAAGYSTHMWIAGKCGSKDAGTIFRVDLNGQQRVLRTRQRGSCPANLVRGPNGNMWFSEGCADQGGSLAEIAMPAGPITEFPVPGNRLEIFGIATGADGNIWFAGAEVRGPNMVGKMTTSGVFTEYPLGDVGVVGVGVNGPDGAVWFPGMQVVNDVAYGYVVRVAMDGSVSDFAIPSEAGSVPTGIVTGTDGNLWVAARSDLYSTGEIVKVTPGGQVTEYPTQSATSIARSTKNRLFFATFGDQIGEISLTGSVRYIKVPQPAATMVALAPDGKEWFVQNFESGGIFVYAP